MGKIKNNREKSEKKEKTKISVSKEQEKSNQKENKNSEKKESEKKEGKDNKKEEGEEKKAESEQKEDDEEKPKIEFIPISEIEEKPTKKPFFLDEVIQERDSDSLDSLIAGFSLEEKTKTNNENPYSLKKESPYSKKNNEENYSRGNTTIRTELKREMVEIRNPPHESSLLTPITFQQNLRLLRMPHQEETYQRDSYRTYEIGEMSPPDDLSRKTKEHKEIDMKYDAD